MRLIGWFDDIFDLMNMSLSKLWEIVKDREAWNAAPWGHKESDASEQRNNNNQFEALTHILCVEKRIYLLLKV